MTFEQVNQTLSYEIYDDESIVREDFFQKMWPDAAVEAFARLRQIPDDLRQEFLDIGEMILEDEEYEQATTPEEAIEALLTDEYWNLDLLTFADGTQVFTFTTVIAETFGLFSIVETGEVGTWLPV